MVWSKPQTTYDDFLRDYGERYVANCKAPAADRLHHTPTDRERTRIRTALVTRADNDSRLLSDFVSSAMRKHRANTVLRQEDLPLTA